MAQAPKYVPFALASPLTRPGVAPGGPAPSGSPAAGVLARRAVASLEEVDRIAVRARALRDATCAGQ